ncbi:MAG: acetate kinase [Planctomycetes bacterium]|nr:acetate kinase [Planctomycetota bacterium]
MKVLVVNAGSSSLKYTLIESSSDETAASGIVERIALDASVHKGEGRGGKFSKNVDAPDHNAALKIVADSLVHPDEGGIDSLDEIGAVGHRVVHGGEAFKESVVITSEVKDTIRSLFSLAPLHNPPNLMGIEACEKLFNVPNVAVFDTAFHSTIPPHAFTYPLPYELYEKDHVRRYGFHGTSHRYVSRKAVEMLGRGPAGTRIVTCHVGNGVSITAVKDGLSVDTSMGFTPLEGVMMGTRCGSIDPAIPLFLAGSKGMAPADVDKMLNKKSGILGLSGVGSSDFRDLVQAVDAGDARARLSFDVYCYRIKLYVGMYAAAMGGIDAVVFTAGIGENAARFRSSVCDGLDFLGVVIDEAANSGGKGDRNIAAGSVAVFVIATREDHVIVEETANLVGHA